MDRLLRYFLQQFIRRGAVTFTTAGGAKFSCGDGCSTSGRAGVGQQFGTTPEIGLLEIDAGLLVCDIEILRLHYAETLKAWRERFMARREEAVRLYDERFARMGIPPSVLGNVVPQTKHDELPNSAHQAPEHCADNPGLHRKGRNPATRRRAASAAAVTDRRRIGPQ